jgi:hypothetical protein
VLAQKVQTLHQLGNNLLAKFQLNKELTHFKQGYVNHIIASIANDTTGVYGKLIPSVTIAKKQTIEDIVIAKFKPYYGKTTDQDTCKTGFELKYQLQRVSMQILQKQFWVLNLTSRN